MLALEAATTYQNEEIEEFGYAMVRPDGLALGLDEPIINRIENSGLLIVKRSLAPITGDQVDKIYPMLHGRHFYPSMKQSLVGRNVMSLIVGGDFEVGKRLLEIKGSAADRNGSVRGHYSAAHLLTSDLRDKYMVGALSEADLQSDEWSTVMQDDRMHSDETAEEAANSIRVMFSEYDITETASRFPALTTFLAAYDSAGGKGVQQQNEE